MFSRRYPSRLSFLALLLVTYVPATAESKKHMAHVWYQSVEVDLNNFVSLAVTGTNKAGDDAERSMKLPRDFLVESEYFSTYGRPGQRSARPWDIERILYKSNGMTYIAGYHRPRFENSADSKGELTNVPWGFDVKTQEFWYEADPGRLPPLPFEFRSGKWQGIRFRIPLHLERFRVEEAQARPSSAHDPALS